MWAGLQGLTPLANGCRPSGATTWSADVIPNHRRYAILASILTLAFRLPMVCAQEPRTVAEKTDYRATSLHADVLAFGEALAKQSPVVRLAEMGTSGEGRKLPLIILADPPVATPE